MAPIERILDQYGIWYDRDKTWAWAIVDKPWGEGIIGWGGGGVYRSWYTWNEIVGDRIHLKVWFGTYGGTWEVWLYGRRLLWATGPHPTEGQLIMDTWYDVPQVENVSLYYENSDILFAGDTIRFYGYVKGTRTWGNGSYRGLEWRELHFTWGPFEETLVTDKNGKYEVTYKIPWGYSGSWYDAYATCEGITSAVRSIAIAWNTRISISAPLSVREGQRFDVTGSLEHETGPATWSPLSKEVTVYYDGKDGEIGSVITDADGGYLITGVIYEKGNYILRSVFASEELGVFVAAEARRDLIVEPPIIPIQWVLLPAVAGVGLAIAKRL